MMMQQLLWTTIGYVKRCPHPRIGNNNEHNEIIMSIEIKAFNLIDIMKSDETEMRQ